jgi:hypothetical protein
MLAVLLLIAIGDGAAPVTPVAPATQAADPALNPRTRFCFKNERAGSIIATKICRTRARWLADGIDPLLAKRVR